MKKHSILIFVMLFFIFSTCFSQKITIKGKVQDEFGREVNNLSISLNKISNCYSDNLFEIDINENDSLHFELDGENVIDTVLRNPDIYHTLMLKLQVDSAEIFYAPITPVFQADRGFISHFIQNNLKYPEDALTNNISGVAHIRFTLNESGERSNYSVIPSVHPAIDKEAIRLLSIMPKMLPVRSGNKYKVANCYYPMDFDAKYYKMMKDTTINSIREHSVFSLDTISKYQQRVKNTEYPGGNKAFAKYIQRNVRKPKEAKKIKSSTRVSLFISIDEDGYLTRTKIMRSANPILDVEAIRIIEAMPRWIPGEKKGYTGPLSAGTSQFVNIDF